MSPFRKFSFYRARKRHLSLYSQRTSSSYIKSVLRYVNFHGNLWTRIKAAQYHKVSINNGVVRFFVGLEGPELLHGNTVHPIQIP